MILSEDPILVGLFTELETAVKAQDSYRIAEVIGQMNERLEELVREGNEVPAELDRFSATLMVEDLDDIASIGS